MRENKDMKKIIIIFTILILANLVFLSKPYKATAQDCAIFECLGTKSMLTSFHAVARIIILNHIDEEFSFQRQWLTKHFFVTIFSAL